MQMRYAKSVVASQWIRTNGLLHSWRRRMEGRGKEDEGGEKEWTKGTMVDADDVWH